MDYPFTCNILLTGQNTFKLLSHQVEKLWDTVSCLSLLTYEILSGMSEFLTYLWEVPNSNLSWNTDYLTVCFHVFSPVLQVSTRTVS
jgi:hypothetical protein